MAYPVFTAIIVSDEDKEEHEKILVSIRELAKKQLGNEWTFLDIQPISISIGECKLMA